MNLDLLNLWVGAAVIAVSLVVYLLAVKLYRRWPASPFLHPIFTMTAVVLLALQLTPLNYEVYMQGGGLLLKLLELAIVALALPIYRSLQRLKGRRSRAFFALALCSVVVCFVGIMPLPFIDVDPQWWRSMLTKSVTTPVALSIANYIDAWPSIAAIAVSISGVLGALFAKGILDRLGISDTAVRGLAQGVCSHAFATATLLERKSEEAGFSALGMGINALLTALWLPMLIVLLAI